MEEGKSAPAADQPRCDVSVSQVKDSQFDAQHDLVTSPVISPLPLAIIRLTLGTYALLVALYHLCWEAVGDEGADSYFSYFTHLSYIGLIAYMFAAGVQTLCYHLNHERGYPLQRWPRPLQHLHCLLYSTITTYPIVVTAIYWGLLSDSSTFSTILSSWWNVSEHALNAAYALFEITLTNAGPSPWWHLPVCVIVLACYLGVAYITHVTQGFYTYSFLDPGKQGGKLAGYIVGIGAAECVVFLLVRGLTWVRMRVLKRACSAGGQQPIEDDWEEVERPRSPIGCAV